jgi:hypothetical protein
MLSSRQHFASVQPESCRLADVDWLWVVIHEPSDVFGVAHRPFAWCNVVVILVPVPGIVELYPWESGVA